MKLRKAMAVALAGALVLTTFATGTTSEAAKKTKLKTKKVSIFVKGKKKISITGKKAKHKYTFTSKKKKIAKVSKTGVITGVKAGKTTITVKDTWKQKGKKKTKKLGTIKVTVKKKATPKPKVTAQVTQAPAPQPPAPQVSQDPNGGGSQTTPPDATQAPTAPPAKTSKPPKTQPPTQPPTPTPPNREDQKPTTYYPANMAEVEQVDGVTYDPETGSISVKDVEQFCIPLGYTVKNGHAIWVKIKGRMNGEQGFRSWMVNDMANKTTLSDQWEAKNEEGFQAPGEFDYTFQLLSESDDVTCLLIKGPVYGTNIDDIVITSLEISYPLGEGSTKPDPEAPTVALDLDKHTITAGSTTTAEVSASAGQIKEVTWSVKDETVAKVEKDAEDAKKATITGLAKGETKVVAEVKVTVEGKDFTIKEEKDLTVAEKGALVVNASIESAPTEVVVGNTAELKVTVDTGTIESVVWKVEGDAATIETDSVEAVKAVLKTVKVGEVTVSATVTVKKDGKTATDTAKVTINVIRDPSDIIEIDITKNITVAGWGNKAAFEVQADGSVKCTWDSGADAYTFVKFNFDGMDLTNYWCVIDAEGDNMNIDITDAVRKEPDWGNPYSVVAPAYGKAFPYTIKLDDAALNPVKDKEGNPADYTNVGGVNIYKGDGTDEYTVIVKSIKFYKYEEDIPKA